MTNKTKVIRQGDLAYIQVSSIPELEESKSGVILQNGSGGNPHTFKGGKWYPKVEGDFIIGYLEAKGTKLFHKEHSPKGFKLKNGYYEVRRQVEERINGLSPVID